MNDDNRFSNILLAGIALLGILVISTMVIGCASTESYGRYLQAQSAAIKAQKPMLKITAQQGQAITGLASIEVYGQGMAIQQEKDNEWARVVTSGLQVVGVVGGIVAAGQASQDLVSAVGGLGITSSVSNINTDNRTYDTHAITDSYNATAKPTVVTQPDPVQIPAGEVVVVQPQVAQP